LSHRAKRILYVHHWAGIGGATNSLLSIIDHLDRSEFSPSVLFNCPPGDAVGLFAERGVRIFQDHRISTYGHAQGAWLGLRSLRPWELLTRVAQIPRSARRFARFLAANQFDLVHLNSSVQIPAALGARRVGMPLVWHVREELHPGYLGVRRRLVRRCLKAVPDAVIVISQVNASHLIASPRVHVIYNFVDLAEFSRAGEADRCRVGLDVAQGRPLVLMLGGIVHSKGADVLIEAAALVRSQVPDALVVIAGMPPSDDLGHSPSWLKRSLRRFLEDLRFLPNVERRSIELIAAQPGEGVRFVGVRQDVPDLLAASDLLVWPSIVSHFARPIIEAGAAGKPVVASDFPSSRELVLAGETGLLVEAGDPRALSDAIVELLRSPERRQRMGERGRTLAAERYDSRVNAERIVEIYRSLLARTPSEAA
jgi:glycosyltransferase involved in cell wall biosynthesis